MADLLTAIPVKRRERRQGWGWHCEVHPSKVPTMSRFKREGRFVTMCMTLSECEQ